MEQRAFRSQNEKSRERCNLFLITQWEAEIKGTYMALITIVSARLTIFKVFISVIQVSEVLLSPFCGWSTEAETLRVCLHRRGEV